MRIVDIKEMKEIEAYSYDHHLDEKLIIETVGSRGALHIDNNILMGSHDAHIVILLGKGNNACDGLAIGRHLSNLGHKVSAFKLFHDKDLSDELANQVKLAQSFGITVNELNSVKDLEGYFFQLDAKILVIDAIFGTGVSLPLSNFLYDVINFINEAASYIVSVDIPSGVHGDTGFVQGNAVVANTTLAIGLAKQGYYLADAVHYIGSVQVIDAGFPLKALTQGNKFLLDFKKLSSELDQRDRFADKKVFGHTLVLGGSHGLTGDLVLAAQSALKVGAGLVTGVTWEPQYHEFISRLSPDIKTGFVPLELERWPNLIKGLEKYSAIVIGPGLAKSTRARKLVLEVLNNFSGPVVLDADAINVLSLKEDKNVFKLRSAPTVITPHFGEFAKFAGVDIEDLKREPVQHLKALIQQINCTILLKGACSFLAKMDGSIYFNFLPNDGMATGGAGDVLAGILGGLLAQESLFRSQISLDQKYIEFDQSIAVGIMIHSLSGLEAAQEYGVRSMSASSLIESFPKVFKKIDDLNS